MSPIGDALLDVVLERPQEPKPDRVDQFMGWLKRVSRPPLGVRLISDDGGRFTGIVIVDENKPLAMLALRVGGSSARPWSDERFDERRPEGLLWREDDDIYR